MVTKKVLIHADDKSETYKMTTGGEEFTVIFEFGNEPIENFLKLLIENHERAIQCRKDMLE